VKHINIAEIFVQLHLDLGSEAGLASLPDLLEEGSLLPYLHGLLHLVHFELTHIMSNHMIVIE
jgi:hypothetical protein